MPPTAIIEPTAAPEIQPTDECQTESNFEYAPPDDVEIPVKAKSSFIFWR